MTHASHAFPCLELPISRQPLCIYVSKFRFLRIQKEIPYPEDHLRSYGECLQMSGGLSIYFLYSLSIYGFTCTALFERKKIMEQIAECKLIIAVFEAKILLTMHLIMPFLLFRWHRKLFQVCTFLIINTVYPGGRKSSNIHAL